MTLAADIANDMATFDGIETVSLYDKSGDTTDATVTGLRRALSHREVQLGGSVGINPTDTVWHLQANTTDIVPDVGDTITDGDAVVYTILSVESATLRTRWRLVTRKQVS